MITSALKWCLDNIPEEQISPQFQLTLRLLRGLVPLLGHIGWFIAWTWSTVRVRKPGTPTATSGSYSCVI